MKFFCEHHKSSSELSDNRVVIDFGRENKTTRAVGNNVSDSFRSQSQALSPITRSQHRRQINNKKKRSLQLLSFLLLSATLILLPAVTSQTPSEDGVTNKSEVTPEEPNSSSASSNAGSAKNESSEVSLESTAAADFGGPPALGDSLNSGQVKLKPINFTLVDEVFETVLSEEEVVKKWKFMDSQLQDGMKSILKMVFPQIVALSQDAKVSGDCSGGILKWILSLRNLRSWAIKMLDATGKPTAGIFEGSLTMFGNYRQCLNIRAPDEDEIEITEQFEEYFRGQFCVIHLKPWMPIKKPFYHLNSTIEPLLRRNYKYYEKTLYDELAEIAIAFNFIDIRMDLCVPSTCTVADIQRVADLLSKKVEMRAKVMRCDIAARDGTTFISQMDRSTYYWAAPTLILFVVALLATILHGLMSQDTASRHRNEQNPVDEHDETTTSKFMIFLECLSFKSVLMDRLSSPLSPFGERNKQSNDDLDSNSGMSDHGSSGSYKVRVPVRLLHKPLPLYGLRNLFIFWFIVVQMTVELKYQYLRESLNLRNMIIGYWPFQIILNSVLLFDSLILITSFTFGYTCLESNLRDLIGYVVDKYVRLILPIISLIGLTIITPLIGIDTPVWRNFVDQQSMVCKSTGYINLFFLQNFISYDKICLPHTWLLCVEFQLIVLSIPLVLLLKKNFSSTEDAVIIGRDSLDIRGQSNLFIVAFFKLLQSKAGILISAFSLAGLAINFFIVYTNQLPPTWFHTFPDIAQKNFYFTRYLTKTWTHLSVFAIGLLAGHLCRTTLQLRSINILKSRQSSQRRQAQQPSPVPSGSTGHSNLTSRHSVHGSTSTIIENGNRSSEEEQADSINTRSTESKMHSKMSRVSLQLASLICMAAIIFSTFTWSTKEGPSVMVAAIYDASSRFIWSLALVLIMIQLCLTDEETNRYSSLARFFAHPLCTMIGRLSFLAYLLSPYIHTFILAVEEQSLFPSLFLIFHVIVGNIVITYTAAFILAIVIEQPLRRLISRMVLKERYRKQKINITYIGASLSSQKQVAS